MRNNKVHADAPRTYTRNLGFRLCLRLEAHGRQGHGGVKMTFLKRSRQAGAKVARLVKTAAVPP